MTRHVDNSGIANFDHGTMKIIGPVAVGPGATVGQVAASQSAGKRENIAVGIVTVLAEEASAVRAALSLRPVAQQSDPFDVGVLPVHGRTVTVAATRASAQGQESCIAAYHRLQERYRPKVIALTGIAGGFHPHVRLADVIVATRVVSYDLRKETTSGTRYRGQERRAPAVIDRAVNEFFTARGEPAQLRSPEPGEDGETFQVLSGPIGSGNAVIADRDSEILRYLAGFNDKILAVDMEAAGFSQAHHEGPPPPDGPVGWLVIRGISDDASQTKNDDYHQLAARHAALVLRELLPYLPL